MMHEPLPKWQEDHYHQVITEQGFQHSSSRNVENAFSFQSHPDPTKQYRVKAIHTYIRRIQENKKNPRATGRKVMERLTAALGRLERKLYPHRIRPIHAHLEIHPLSAIGQEQGQSQLQNYWQLVVHELQEFERKKPRR